MNRLSQVNERIGKSAEGNRPRINKIKIATNRLPFDFFSIYKTHQQHPVIQKKLTSFRIDQLATPTFSDGIPFKPIKKQVFKIPSKQFKMQSLTTNKKEISNKENYLMIEPFNQFQMKRMQLKPIRLKKRMDNSLKKCTLNNMKQKRGIRIKSYCTFQKKTVETNKL